LRATARPARALGPPAPGGRALGGATRRRALRLVHVPCMRCARGLWPRASARQEDAALGKHAVHPAAEDHGRPLRTAMSVLRKAQYVHLIACTRARRLPVGLRFRLDHPEVPAEPDGRAHAAVAERGRRSDGRRERHARRAARRRRRRRARPRRRRLPQQRGRCCAAAVRTLITENTRSVLQQAGCCLGTCSHARGRRNLCCPGDVDR